MAHSGLIEPHGTSLRPVCVSLYGAGLTADGG